MKKILVINDLASIGHTSLNVNIPILSACGYDVIPLVTTTLSRHTAYKNALRVDINDSFERIINNFIENNDTFNCILIGYLANANQIDLIIPLLKNNPHAYVVLDPVCADNGKFYQGINQDYALQLRKLFPYINLLLPNVTESLALTNHPLSTKYSLDSIVLSINELNQLAKTDIVISGLVVKKQIQCAIYEQGTISTCHTSYINAYVPGTGDAFASLIVAKLLVGHSLNESVAYAMQLIYDTIINLINTQYDLMQGIPMPQLLKQLVNDFK